MQVKCDSDYTEGSFKIPFNVLYQLSQIKYLELKIPNSKFLIVKSLTFLNKNIDDSITKFNFKIIGFSCNI